MADLFSALNLVNNAVNVAQNVARAATGTAARDIGAAVGAVLRPDGEPVLPGIQTNLNRGTVQQTTGLRGSSATVAPGTPPIQDSGKTLSKSGVNVRGIPNPLENFATWSPLWTMAALTPRQFNNPKSYRKSLGDLKNVIFSSGGRADGARTTLLGGIAPEYFVNNFVMQNQISASQKTGNSNAITFTWDIYEPYSMGMLLQSMQLAALEAGYSSYLDNTPYVLRLDFVGYTDDGTPYTILKPKFFTMKLTKIKFQVTESGSVYKCEGIPYNHQGFSNVINKLYSDIAVKGSTVAEALCTSEQNLVTALNKIETDSVTSGKTCYPDVYKIVFPENSQSFENSAEGSEAPKFASFNPAALAPILRIGNASAGATTTLPPSGAIASSTLGFGPTSAGNQSFNKTADVVNEKTGKNQKSKMTPDPKVKTLQYKQEMPITHVIANVVMSSQYAYDTLLPGSMQSDGTYNWFKVDVQIKLKENQFDERRKDYAKEITYRVIPYKVHSSVFSGTGTGLPGYGEIEKKIGKQYNYIYTGQNNDLLKFDIDINNLFYSGVNPKGEENSSKTNNQDQRAGEERPVGNQVPEGGDDATRKTVESANTGKGGVKADFDQQRIKGGSGEKNKTLVAQSFQSAFLKNNGDMINMNVEILGDPYWLVDSGIGNYFAEPGANDQVTGDGTMNYEGSDVYIYITFRTPIDVGDPGDGLYSFAAGKSQESPFSGIYKVTFCENKFVDGTFKQTLKCFRMPYQAADFDQAANVEKAQVPASVKKDQAEPAATTVTETNIPPVPC
jgi:hypothetical protein